MERFEALFLPRIAARYQHSEVCPFFNVRRDSASQGGVSYLSPHQEQPGLARDCTPDCPFRNGASASYAAPKHRGKLDEYAYRHHPLNQLMEARCFAGMLLATFLLTIVPVSGQTHLKLVRLSIGICSGIGLVFLRFASSTRAIGFGMTFFLVSLPWLQYIRDGEVALRWLHILLPIQPLVGVHFTTRNFALCTTAMIAVLCVVTLPRACLGFDGPNTDFFGKPILTDTPCSARFQEARLCGALAIYVCVLAFMDQWRKLTYWSKMFWTNRDLMASLLAADEANAAKSSFIANISHELRTPLNGIMGTVEGALLAKAAKPLRKELETIKQCGGLLRDTIGDILEVTRLSSNKLDIDQAPMQIADLLHRAVETLGLKAYDKRVNVVVDVTALTNVTHFLGDAERMREVFWRILSNSIKFSHESSEVVVRAASVEIAEEEASNLSLSSIFPSDAIHRVTIEFIDKGVGMSEETVASLYEPFARADASSTRTTDGTGLGLTISHSIVKLLGGDIRVKSTLGAGSTFKLQFDLKVLSAPERLPAVATLTGVSGAKNTHKKHIAKSALVVDSSPAQASVTSNYLTRLGYSVSVCDTEKWSLMARQYDLCVLTLHSFHTRDLAAAELLKRILSGPEPRPASRALVISNSVMRRMGATDGMSQDLFPEQFPERFQTDERPAVAAAYHMLDAPIVESRLAAAVAELEEEDVPAASGVSRGGLRSAVTPRMARNATASSVAPGTPPHVSPDGSPHQSPVSSSPIAFPGSPVLASVPVPIASPPAYYTPPDRKRLWVAKQLWAGDAVRGARRASYPMFGQVAARLAKASGVQRTKSSPQASHVPGGLMAAEASAPNRIVTSPSVEVPPLLPSGGAAAHPSSSGASLNASSVLTSSSEIVTEDELEKPRALIVDDNRINVAVLKRLMTLLGFEPVTAADGVEGVRAYDTAADMEPFTVVLMDLHMPNMNGVDAARTIRELEERRRRLRPYQLPTGQRRPQIIAVSADTEAPTREREFGQYFDGFLAKPFLLDTLRKVLRDSNVTP